VTRGGWLAGAAAALFAAMLACPVEAQQFYIGGEGGWTYLNGQNGAANIPAGSPLLAGTPAFMTGAIVSTHSNWNSGFNVGARAGYEWGPWRFEEEFRYQQNGIDTLAHLSGVQGDRDAYAFMTNVLYDFNFDWPLTPHVGVGIGAVDVTEDVSQNSGVGTISNGSDWAFGYQAIGGFRYGIAPNLALDFDYRYFATTNIRFPLSGGGTSKTGYGTSNIVASLSYLFNAPPPPPPSVVVPAAAPAPPPPAMSRDFLIFFDWDKDTITPAGVQIVQQAADAWKSGAPVQIQVVGYTDRSGSPGYNQRLSERRANNVATALGGLGVPREQMAVSGRGENDNRVPTAPGVREPQNRRVEIVFP
jgi:OOP family OmpA-OmpF porin